MVTYVAALLLYAMSLTDDVEKLKKLAEALKQCADEIEAFTLAFKLMMEPPRADDLEIVARARISTELRKVLGPERSLRSYSGRYQEV